MAEKLSAVFSAISLGQISKIKQINYTENGQSLDTRYNKAHSKGLLWALREALIELTSNALLR